MLSLNIFRFNVLLTLASGLIFFSASISAVDGPQQSKIPSNQKAQLFSSQLNSEQVVTNEALSLGQYPSGFRQGQMLPGEQRIEMLLPPPEAGVPAPFGANLFAGGYESERIDGLNEDYLIAPGDKISVWMWGAVNVSEVVTVDSQGNIFLPKIGPIKVENSRASEVNRIVTGAIKKVYPKNVSVYVNLLTATPVSVYIAGPVIRPGQYAGMASDSILYFLKRAGGIDADRGSYRHISVVRNGQFVQTFDLYEFLIRGQLPAFSFKDRDVILVEQQGATVTVMEGARNPFRFEFAKDVATGTELAQYARPLSKISHVGVIGTRNNGPFSVYLPYAKFAQFKLKDGDRLLFNDDWDPEIYDIKISGSHLGPSYYTVAKKTRLYDLLNHIEIDLNLSDYLSVHIHRESVAERQKEILDRALDRLERSVFTAPVQSEGEGAIRAQEAALVTDFVARAKQIEPLGKVVVSENGIIANIQLEQGDEIIIPQKTDLIQIGGEVLMPKAVVYNPNASIEDYIAWAGGYTERANFERIVIYHANGLTTFVDNQSDSHWFSGNSSDAKLKPGDQILVLPRVDAKNLQMVKDMTQILYQVAIAAKVVLD